MKKLREYWINNDWTHGMAGLYEYRSDNDSKYSQCREVDPNRDALFDEMLEALKGAIRIKDLWAMAGEVSQEHVGEAEALGTIQNTFEYLITRAELSKYNE